MSLFDKIRLKYFIATRTIGYTEDYIQHLYKIYLNHNKIIHYRNGYPVYSLSTPPLFSKPAANFFARTMYRSIQNRNIPNMMSFAVNDVCNAVCKHCSFFEGVEDKSKKVLTLDEAKDAIKQAQDLGVSVFNFVGGEPLLRKDLPEIIRSIDKDRSTAIMFTNGWYLEERIKELKEAGLDGVYISIDSSKPKTHDAIRRKEGLYEKAFQGAQKALELGLSVGMSVCLTPELYKKGEFDNLIEIAKSKKLHEMLVFDAMPTGRYKNRTDLIDNNDWLDEMIEHSRKYNEDESYPGIFIWAYATSHQSVGCSCGTSYMYVSPYGDIMSCDFNHAIFGSLRDEKMFKIWDRLSNMDDFCKSKWGGCKIKDSTFRNKDTVQVNSSCC